MVRKKLLRATLSLAVLSFSSMTAAPESLPESTVILSPVDIIVTNGAVWEGWGTSLCWWANRIGYSQTLVQQSAKLFFDSTDGLGLNIMRYNIGGGDDPEHHHITRTDSDVPGWLIHDAATGTAIYDYMADSCQLNVLEAAAKAAGQDAYIEVFSNSPPYFMTNSGCSTGNIKAEENNLRDDSYTAFSQYLAHVASYMRNVLKLNVRSLAPMNEPDTNYWPAFNYKQEGCHFDAGDSQSTILTETRKSLDAAGLTDVIVTASDETNPGKQLNELRTYSPEALHSIGRISTHTYGINQIRELGNEAARLGMNIWMSEVDGNGTTGENAGQMAAALWIANKIIFDITSLEPSAWVLWQVIDTHVSRNGYKGRRDTGPLRVEGGYWGTAYANHDDGTIYLSQKYYAFGQFSRYIRPGASLIKCNTGIDGCQAIAAIDAGRNKMTVVLTNATASLHNLDIDFSKFNVKRGKAVSFRTSGTLEDGEHWTMADKTFSLRDAKLSVTLIPNSITTYVVDIK